MSINFIDDRDQSITYIGPWSRQGSPNEYNSTTTLTAIAGSMAIINISDISDISIWGTIGPKSSEVVPRTSYRIDKEKPTIYTATPIPGGSQYRQLFFRENHLSPGPHILNITLLVNGSFWLDYINVTLVKSRSTDASTLPTTVTELYTLESATTTAIETIYLPEASSEVDQSPPGTKSSTASTLVIVGSILGGMALLILFGATIWWLVKKRRERRANTFRNEFMVRLYSNPWKKREEPTQNPLDYEYGQPMSTENPKMFHSSFATDDLKLEPVRPHWSRCS